MEYTALQFKSTLALISYNMFGGNWDEDCCFHFTFGKARTH